MGNQEIRTPQQQRSIEKRNRIIEAGYLLFCEKGYRNTNTAEIAKKAGVSTGIIYSYFKDKKDIFLCIAQDYSNQIFGKLFEALQDIQQPFDLPVLIKNIIHVLIDAHTMSKSMHQEMAALSYTEPELEELMDETNEQLVLSIMQLFDQYGIHPSNSKEKIHMIIDLVESLCHKIIYNKHNDLNYDVMIDTAVELIIAMLRS